jgi:hypothetical protein
MLSSALLILATTQERNSQKFLINIRKIFETSRGILVTVIINRDLIYNFHGMEHQLLMKSDLEKHLKNTRLQGLKLRKS